MDGILVVNKPKGPTSRDVVNRVQRCMRPAKVGHAGTLDPLATGVLVIGIGAGTRLVQYVQQSTKTYVGDFRFGLSSDTEDITGNCVLHDDQPVVSHADFLRILPTFVGQIQQRPPAYSALKIDGERAYDLARRGEVVELAAREIVIRSLELTRFTYPDFQLTIACESGTYVRSLGRDIAESLAAHAVMTDLVRTAIGNYSLDRAIEMEAISRETVAQSLLPLSSAVSHLPAVTVDAQSARSLRQGKLIRPEDCDSSALTNSFIANETEVAASDSAGQLVAICLWQVGTDQQPLLKPHKVMPESSRTVEN